MTLFYSVGYSSNSRHLLRKFRDTGAVEAFCGRLLSGAISNRGSPICKKCETMFNELIDTISEFKCNLCDFTCKGQDQRDGHYESKHPVCIKSESDKRESRKWFTIILRKNIMAMN